MWIEKIKSDIFSNKNAELIFLKYLNIIAAILSLLSFPTLFI